MRIKKILIDLDGVLNEYGKEGFEENYIPPNLPTWRSINPENFSPVLEVVNIPSFNTRLFFIKTF